MALRPLSRDTRVHLAVIVVTILLVAAASRTSLLDGPEGTDGLALFVIPLYALLLGGAHLYLALRGHDGMVPTRSRWRFLAALAAVLCGAALVAFVPNELPGGYLLQTLGLVLAVLAALGYLVAEVISGYESVRAD